MFKIGRQKKINGKQYNQPSLTQYTTLKLKQ